MEVQWKNILDSNYDVSNTGQIRNRKSQRVLKQQFNHNGYPVITIYVGDRKRTLFVHRLVAMAFIPNPNNYPQINHKDEIKTHNAVTNLEWCNAKYNSNYGTRNARRVKHTDYAKRNKTYGYRHRMDNVDMVEASRPLYRSVDMVDINTHRVVKHYESVRKAARDIGGVSSRISEALNGKRKSAYGYFWSSGNQRQERSADQVS